MEVSPTVSLWESPTTNIRKSESVTSPTEHRRTTGPGGFGRSRIYGISDGVVHHGNEQETPREGTSVPLKAWRQMEEISHTSSEIILTSYLVYRVFPSDPYLGHREIGLSTELARCFCAACQLFRPQRPNRSSFTDTEPVVPRFVRSDDTNYAGRKEDALERGGRQSKNHTMGKLIGGNSCVYVNYKQQPLGIL
ncbi:hypothetical protein ARMGADRAFT_482102 [Armillaria gallica]|uniref:Uncharacterized protein n=1 Tax=Armillaria gallica TaxID=47427 RepID=A0A2H3E6U0_ARMGA|nr:hypothetical protein ARMGADRAFT_482102 [Armillaria gallica]